MRQLGFFTLGLIALQSAGWAATLISTSGPFIGYTGTGAVSFTTTSSFTNVAIQVGLFNFSGSPIDTSIDAYLTTQIGPGTNASHEVDFASVNVSLPVLVGDSSSNIVDVQVFSGLSLAPGTYYLSLSPTTSIGIMWSWIANTDTIVVGGGTTLNRDQYTFTPDGYFPASSFPHTDISGYLRYSVTGDPVTDGVPEPATLWLTAAAGIGLACLRSRASR